MKTSNFLKFISCIILILFHTGLNAQIGINTDTIDLSAVLQISADHRGLLIPSLPDSGLIEKPADGLVFYNNAQKAYYIHTGNSWKIMVPFEILNDTSISTSYNITLKADALIQNEFTVNGNVKANKDILANGNIVANGNVTANRNVTISGNISAQNYVNNVTGNGPVPKGGIIMWSGAIAGNFEMTTGIGLANGPLNGWALCNGLNGTPDLRDKFIVGAGSHYQPGFTGGKDSVALDTTQIPRHNHIAYGTISGGTHNHAYYLYDDQINTGVYGEGSDVGNNRKTAYTNTDGAHTHNANTIRISFSGQGKYHENRPPYYALAYIIKL